MRKDVKPWPRAVQALVMALIMGLFLLASFEFILWLHAVLASAGIAASTFIAFAYPTSDAGRPKVMLGGYLCGLVGGGLASFLRHRIAPGESLPELEVCVLLCALAMTVCALLMMLLQVQHPPAAAFALTVVVDKDPVRVGLSVLGVVVALCLVRLLVLRLLGPRLGIKPKNANEQAADVDAG